MVGREKEELREITLLGNQGTKYQYSYDPTILEVFDNKHPNNDYFVKFNCPEFTSLCPITGQPDFATIYISYIPSEKMVESKSLKLYLFSFRNHGDFHEVVNGCSVSSTRPEHPFTTSLGPGDTRITTHYFEEDIESALFSTIHERG